MKNIFLLILFILSFFGCSKKSEVEYYKSGQLKYKVELEKGQWNGKYIEFYKNGKIHWIISYKKGEKDGKATKYFPSGKLEADISYKSNLLNGASIWYYENGRISGKYSYKNGKIHGIARWYNKDSSISESYYELGKLKRERTYDSAGNYIVYKNAQYEKYNKEGVLIGRNMKINYILKKGTNDTTRHGKQYYYSIALANPLHDKIQVILFKCDSINKTLGMDKRDTIIILKPTNKRYSVEGIFLPEKVGKHKICGELEEIKVENSGKETIMNSENFTWELEVL